MSTSDFDFYDPNLKRYPVMTREEEREVVAHLPALWARDRLICANLRFVNTVAAKYQYFSQEPHNWPMADIVAEGRVGLITAIDRFDPDRGVKLISYAVWWIKQAILGAAARQHIIWTPMNILKDRRHIDEMEDLGYDDETAEEFVSKTQRRAVEETTFSIQSLDAEAYGSESDATYHEKIAADIESPDVLVEQEMTTAHINSALAALQPREALYVTARYGLDGATPRTLQSIGDEANLTKERVRQILSRVMKGKLRKALEAA